MRENKTEIIHLPMRLTLQEKLEILADAAKYDASCASRRR
jgi:hypothetical protein